MAAVSYYRYKLRAKILQPKTTLRGDEPGNLWDFINDILDGERGDTWDYPKKVYPGFFWGASRMLRGIALVRYYVVTAAAWRHDKIYRSIKKVLKTKKV